MGENIELYRFLWGLADKLDLANEIVDSYADGSPFIDLDEIELLRVMAKVNSCLTVENGGDFALMEKTDGPSSVWITVKNLSVNVSRKDEGVSITVYPVGDEMDGESITETWALYTEAHGGEHG